MVQRTVYGEGRTVSGVRRGVSGLETTRLSTESQVGFLKNFFVFCFWKVSLVRSKWKKFHSQWIVFRSISSILWPCRPFATVEMCKRSCPMYWEQRWPHWVPTSRGTTTQRPEGRSGLKVSYQSSVVQTEMKVGRVVVCWLLESRVYVLRRSLHSSHFVGLLGSCTGTTLPVCDVRPSTPLVWSYSVY